MSLTDWKDWELIQRRDALASLIEAYLQRRTPLRRYHKKLRRYQAEMDAIIAEIDRRHHVKQMDLFDLLTQLSVLDSID